MKEQEQKELHIMQEIAYADHIPLKITNLGQVWTVTILFKDTDVWISFWNTNTISNIS